MPTATRPAALARLYIPSADPTVIPALKDRLTPPDAVMAWNVYVHKPQGRPAYAYGVEGSKSSTSFQTMHPGSATIGPVAIPNPATLARKRAALKEVVSRLHDAGRITFEAALQANAKIDAAASIEA